MQVFLKRADAPRELNPANCLGFVPVGAAPPSMPVVAGPAAAPGRATAPIARPRQQQLARPVPNMLPPLSPATRPLLGKAGALAALEIVAKEGTPLARRKIAVVMRDIRQGTPLPVALQRQYGSVKTASIHLRLLQIATEAGVMPTINQ